MREETVRRRRKHRRQRRNLGCLMSVALLLVLALGLLLLLPKQQKNDTLRAFAEANGLEADAWPEELVELLEKNPEAEDFVLNYPLKKDLVPQIDLQDCVGTDTVPLLLQWDERWGYGRYAGELMGLSGCGPTCLSMVCLYLLDDPALTPRAVAAFAEEHGYSERGSGSAWTLISVGGEQLGLEVEELPLHKETILRELESGNPVICVVGAGDFTTTGHFIVLTGTSHDGVSVNDPNSPARSAQVWELERVMEQIKNLWVCRAP